MTKGRISVLPFAIQKLNLLQALTAKRSPNFYNITKSQGRVVRFCLFKHAYKLGEDIVGTFDFSEATVPCVQVKLLTKNFTESIYEHRLLCRIFGDIV
jgi:hypothetical protein